MRKLLFFFFVAKVRGEVFAHFHAVAAERQENMQNWPFGLLGQIFSENPLDVKENC
jgi:hypothetical protein